jgi:cell division septum initiation protein DivIVA
LCIFILIISKGVIYISEENVKSILELIEDLVLNSPKIPVFNKLIIDEDKLFGLLDELNKNLPAEMTESKLIVENKERILAEADQKYAELLNSAESKSNEILSSSELKSKELVSNAEIRSKDLLTQAEIKSKDLVVSAETKAKLLVSESEIIKKALVEVNSIKYEATKEIDSKNNEVYGYAETVLEKLEEQLSDAISVIRNGRESLSQS